MPDKGYGGGADAGANSQGGGYSSGYDGTGRQATNSAAQQAEANRAAAARAAQQKKEAEEFALAQRLMINDPSKAHQKSFWDGFTGKTNENQVSRVGDKAKFGSFMGDTAIGLALGSPLGGFTGLADEAIADGLTGKAYAGTNNPSFSTTFGAPGVQTASLNTPTFGGKQRGTQNNSNNDGSPEIKRIASALMGTR